MILIDILIAENADLREGYNEKSVFADAFVIPLGC
jgi:hypothetical protein